ncbi:hypothetical protein [Acaryochloris sp. CCMEE 5410]|uniref:hypothetical protein n=1 Tax=Acaryochloris sp. CCMEE 5410 TaxID=310037 RepID=UPI00111201DF|nr:hypothetical protein [Acaryochloris sp. CCMEE 5410]KAI9134916.1 hypothetical protein ON05_017740 [Acaryochloris sp. CCMEE 5410]
MSYATLLKEHVSASLKTSSITHKSYQTCILVMPKYVTQSNQEYTEKLFQTICEAITSNKYIVLDFQNTRLIDSYGAKVIAELFQTAYNFTVGLGYIHLSTQLECCHSITGYSPFDSF